jgi:hypothetical protein
LDARVGEVRDELGGGVGRAVVDHGEPPALVALREHRGDRLRDPGGGVAGGDDDADTHGVF